MFFCRDKLDIFPSLFMRKKRRQQRKRNGWEREQNRLGATTMRQASVSCVLKVFFFLALINILEQVKLRWTFLPFGTLVEARRSCYQWDFDPLFCSHKGQEIKVFFV